MRTSSISSVGPGMALLALGLLAIGLMKFDPGPLLAHRPSSAAKTPAANKPQVVETFGKLPLYFIENQGQLDPRVVYYIQGGDKSIYFTGRGVTFALTGALTGAGEEEPSSEALAHSDAYGGTGVLTSPSRSRLGLALAHPVSYRGIGGAKEHGPQRPGPQRPGPQRPGPQREVERWVVKLDFVDANPNVRPVGQEPTAAVISYFKGPREEWTTGLPTYASLVYRDLWPGIDLVYTGTGSRLKYTFLVQPGADPNQIQLAYRGASEVQINEAGQLEVSTPLEDFQEDKPYAYQEVEGQDMDLEVEVAAAYSLEGETSDGVQFGFRLGAYDPHKVLVLDPVVLLYASYIGGSSSDIGRGIALDSTGAAHVIGTTFSSAVDSMGHAYVTGNTESSEASFPVTVGPDLTFNGDFDAFVAKIGDQPLEAPSPILAANSVVNGASFRPATESNSAIAPGAMVAIFGTDLAGSTLLAGEVPLPTTLGDTSVTFNNIAAPLFFVSGTQINAQVPFELMTGAGTVTVQVTRGSQTSAVQPIGIAAASPGIFTLNRQGTGAGAILHAGNFQPVSESDPAQPGEFLAIFCTGLGPVQPEVQSGQIAPSTAPLAETLNTPLVNIAGIPADVTFSGLAPGFVGLYQVNVEVPAGVPSGTQNVEIIINGVPSNTVTITVQ